MTGDRSTPEPTRPLDERAAWRVMRERRRRVWRGVFVVVVVTLAMAVLLVINRDNQAIRSCRERMEHAVAELQRLHDQGAPIPLELPFPTQAAVAGEAQKIRMRKHVYYNAFFATRIGFAREVGVCCCNELHTRLILPNGRHVIIYNVERRAYELHWMNEAEFARQAQEIGLQVPAAP